MATVKVGDDLFIEVPHMAGFTFPNDMLLRVTPSDFGYTPDRNAALVHVTVESVPRPVDRPVSATAYEENGHKRVTLDMPEVVACKVFWGSVNDVTPALDPLVD